MQFDFQFNFLSFIKHGLSVLQISSHHNLSHPPRHHQQSHQMFVSAQIAFSNNNKALLSLFVSNSSTNPSIPNLHFMCIRCPSITHRSRVLPSSTPDFAFLCPPYADPKFSYFKIVRSGIEFHANKVLAAAAEILANTLTRSDGCWEKSYGYGWS